MKVYTQSNHLITTSKQTFDYHLLVLAAYLLKIHLITFSTPHLTFDLDTYEQGEWVINISSFELNVGPLFVLLGM